jgi:hypothetical protein
VLRSRVHGAIPPLPQYAFMAWCSVKAQGQLYLLPLSMPGNIGSPIRIISLPSPCYSEVMGLLFVVYLSDFGYKNNSNYYYYYYYY